MRYVDGLPRLNGGSNATLPLLYPTLYFTTFRQGGVKIDGKTQCNVSFSALFNLCVYVGGRAERRVSQVSESDCEITARMLLHHGVLLSGQTRTHCTFTFVDMLTGPS